MFANGLHLQFPAFHIFSDIPDEASDCGKIFSGDYCIPNINKNGWLITIKTFINDLQKNIYFNKQLQIMKNDWFITNKNFIND